MHSPVNPALDATIITQPQHSHRRDRPKVSAKKRNSIPGWGADLPLERRVGHPREGSYTAAENGAHWDQPQQQVSDVRIFHTIERPGITPVFGTTLPPRGLSGIVRGYAYSLGEGQRRRWMSLLLADRIDVLESSVFNLVFKRRYYARDPLRVRPAAIAIAAISIAGLALYAARNLEGARK